MANYRRHISESGVFRRRGEERGISRERMFISSSWRLTKRNNGVVEQGTEQSSSLRVDAAQLQGEEHGGDGGEVPGQENKDVKSIRL